MSENDLQFILSEPEDIYGALRRLVLNGEQVKVQIDGGQEFYRSLITNTDLKSRSFFMEQVFPFAGNDLIRAGHRFSIESDSDGVNIKFKINGRLAYQPQKNLYRVEFPESVLYLQRRGAYRVNVPEAHNIRLRLTMNDQEGDLTADLRDISSSGFKAVFKGNVKKRLQDQSVFSIARLRFNRKHDMDCSLKVHHIESYDQGQTIAGFEFLSVSATAQRYIDRLITELQWEERERKRMLSEDQELPDPL